MSQNDLSSRLSEDATLHKDVSNLSLMSGLNKGFANLNKRQQQKIENKDQMELLKNLHNRKKKCPKGKDDTYNPYLIPADVKVAQDHLLANRVGTELICDRKQDGEYQEVATFCHCCGMQIQREQFALSCETEKLGYLGSGYSLFFDFQKFCFGIVFMMFMTSGLYNLSSNLMGDNCMTLKQIKHKYPHYTPDDLKRTCVESWAMTASFANKISNEEFISLQSIMNFATIVIVVVALQFFRKGQRETNVLCDEANITAGDFSATIKFIPHSSSEVNYKLEIKEALEKEGYWPEEISLCYDLNEYFQIKKRLETINIKKMKNILKIKGENKKKREERAKKEKEEGKKEQKGNLGLLSKLGTGLKMQEELVENDVHIENEFQEQKKELDIILAEFESGKTDKFTGTAYVVFQTEAERDDLLERFEYKSSWTHFKRYLGKSIEQPHLEILKEKVVVESACEPLDVYWENQSVSTNVKIRSRIMSRLADVLTLALLLYLIVLSMQGQSHMKDDIQNKTDEQLKQIDYQVKMVGIAISLFVTVCNNILAVMVTITTAYEKWSTKTRHNIALAQKLSIAQFTNTALLQFIICILITNNFYGQGGLIYNTTFIFLSDMVVGILLQLINVSHVIKYFSRKYYLKFFPMQTQKDLQLIYEQPAYPIALLYAALVKSMFFCAFYAPVIPIGILFCMISTAGMYWVNKYNLLRKSIVKEQMSAELSREMTEMIEYVLVIYAVTNTLFEYCIVEKVNYVSIAGVVCGIVNAFLPMESINKRIFPTRPDFNTPMDYKEALREMDTDYGRANPAIEVSCKKKFIDRFSSVNKD